MFNKIPLLTAILTLVCINSANAAHFYVGPSLVWHSVASDPMHYEGLGAKLSIGYEPTLYSLFNLGLEIWGEPFQPITHRNVTAGIGSIKPNYNYGFSVLPGYVLDDVIKVFFRGSVLRTDFADFGIHNGWQAGVGFEVIWSCASPWHFRAEWDYSRYQSVSGLSDIIDGQYSLGFIYLFKY